MTDTDQQDPGPQGPDRDDAPMLVLGPERMFRFGTIVTVEGGVRASCASGPWLGQAGSGVGSLGSLGVLLDDVLGYAIIEHRPPDRWSVSAEIGLELLEPLPVDGTALHAQARLQHVDGIGGLSVGEVRDDAGRLLAVGRQRGRFVPIHREATPATEQDGPVRPDAADLATLLGLSGAGSGSGSGSDPAAGPGAEVSFVVTPELENPMHNLHGGISLAVADVVAARALADGGPPLVVNSIHVIYARGIPAGSEVAVSAVVQHRGRGLGVVEVVGSVDGRAATIARVVAGPPSPLPAY